MCDFCAAACVAPSSKEMARKFAGINHHKLVSCQPGTTVKISRFMHSQMPASMPTAALKTRLVCYLMSFQMLPEAHKCLRQHITCTSQLVDVRNSSQSEPQQCHWQQRKYRRNGENSERLQC
eukprot:4323998-Pleurochrysis_carterae.AAC.6